MGYFIICISRWSPDFWTINSSISDGQGMPKRLKSIFSSQIVEPLAIQITGGMWKPWRTGSFRSHKNHTGFKRDISKPPKKYQGVKHESEETQKKQRTREQQKHQRPYYLFLGNYNTFIPTKNQLYKKAPVRAKSLLSRWRMSRALFRSLLNINDHRPLTLTRVVLRFAFRQADVLHIDTLRGPKHLRWVGASSRTRYNVSLRWIWLQSACEGWNGRTEVTGEAKRALI